MDQSLSTQQSVAPVSRFATSSEELERDTLAVLQARRNRQIAARLTDEALAIGLYEAAQLAVMLLNGMPDLPPLHERIRKLLSDVLDKVGAR